MENQASPEIINDDDTPVPMWKSALTYGVYYAVLGIAITVIFYATGNILSKALQPVGVAIMVAAIVAIQLTYRKQLGGYISYGQALSVAVFSMFFASVISSVFTYLLYAVIDPGLIEQIRLATEEQLYERGMSDEQIAAAMQISAKFQSPLIIAISGLFAAPFFALIIGLITSIFIKKNDPEKIFE